MLLKKVIALSVGLDLGSLIPLRVIENGALRAIGLPTRLKLLNWGDNPSTQGNIRVGLETLKSLAANQAAEGFDRIALDYDHNSLKTHPNYKPDPREVAGFGVPKIIEGDGLYLEQIVYTPSGKKYALNYADLSPTPRLTVDGEVDFLHSVALCPQGCVEGLRFLSVGQITSAADEQVRKVLGISREDWARHGGGGMAALSSQVPRESGADDPQKIPRLLGIPKEAWDRKDAPEPNDVQRLLGISQEDWDRSENNT